MKMVASNRVNLARYGCPIGTLNAELGKESCDHQDVARGLFDVFVDWLTLQFKELNNPKQARARARALHLLGRAEGISIIAHVYNDSALVSVEVKVLEEWIDEL